MRFHVLGLGSIGSLLSSHLRRALPESHSITLIRKLPRYAFAAQARGSTIHVEQAGVVSTITDFSAELFDASQPQKVSSESPQPETEEKNNTIESLFITTKAHSTLSAIKHLLPRLTPNTTIVLLQNGMGVYERLVETVFRNPLRRPHFILASNTHGAFLKAPNHVVHAGVGKIQFGIAPDASGRQFDAAFRDEPYRAQLTDITTPNDPEFDKYKSLRNTVAALLLTDSLNTSWLPMDHIQIAMRRKLVVNCVVNPLTALLNCLNGEIFRSDYGIHIMQCVCREAAEVFATEHAQNASSELDRVAYSLTASALEAECLRVADVTGSNISSMLADVRAAKETEIDYLNGYLLGLGKKYNIKMPVNSILTDLIKMRSVIPLDQNF